MAKSTLNSALRGIHGKIDAWVYRNYGDRTVISRRPEGTDARSPAQLAIRAAFKEAAAYAKAALADPVRRAIYATIAKARGRPLFATALTDYLKPPVVDAIDLGGYHGAAGDPIVVHASDDIEVTAVTVVIRDETDAVLEQGAAVAQDGTWHYTATAAVPPGQSVTIEATATDRPGHAGAKLTTWTQA